VSKGAELSLMKASPSGNTKRPEIRKYEQCLPNSTGRATHSGGLAEQARGKSVLE